MVLHPSAFLPIETLSQIRKYAEDAEKEGQLHKEQLELIYNQQWFKMFVPKRYGGLEFSLPEVLKTEEALAWADGSTAWVVTLCSGAGWFVGFLDPDLSRKIFPDRKTCIAGSGALTGTAEVRKDGYTINGAWKYASGALHATMFTANCVITKGGVPLTSNEGKPQIKAFIFYPQEVLLQRTWNSMGLIATGSHGFAINNLFVLPNRAFEIASDHVTLASNVYQYPFMQLAETTLAVNLSGMAQQFLDLCAPLFTERMARMTEPKKELMNLLQLSLQRLQECRNEFYKGVEDSWGYCKDYKPIPNSISSRVSDVSFRLYQTSLSIVNNLYPNAGLGAADVSTEINRVWRNIHTASQHSLFTRR